MTQHPQGRTPTDIAGSPYRESQIRQDEREKVLDLLIRVYANLAHTYTEEDDVEHWKLVRDTKEMIKELRKGGVP
jgi:hypothetical protein